MRDELILGIRPKLDLNVSDSNELEAFQNITLRPILKLQNALTSQLLDNSGHFQKMIEKTNTTDSKAYGEAVRNYVSSNIVFKSKVLGIIVGLMIVSEFDFYSKNTSEVNKRIMNMQIQRYIDNRFQAEQ